MKQSLRLFLLSLTALLCSTAMASTETITFSELGYDNAYELTTISGTNVTLTFGVGTGTTTPKYYTSGTAVRLYAGNTLTVSSDSTITSIVFSYVSSSYAPASTLTDLFDGGAYDYDTYTWTGSANSLVMTNSGSSQIRITAMTITTGDSSDSSTDDGSTDGTDDSTGDGTTDDSTGDGTTDGDTDSGTTDVTTTDVTFDFTTNPAYDMEATSESSFYLTNDTTIVVDGVSLTLSGKYRLWSGSSVDLRIYNGSTMTLGVEDGQAIRTITFAGSKLTNQTAGSGTYDSGTWTGNAQSVTFTQSGTVQVSTIVVGYATADDDTVVDGDTTDDTDDGTTDDGTTDDGTTDDGTTDDGSNISTYKTYVKATTVESGKEYLIVAQRDDMTYYAYPLSASYTYGYINTYSVSGYTDTLQISTDYEDGFVITESDGLYSIKDVAYSKSYYHSSTYNNFNATTADTAVWTIDAQDDGTFKIAATDGYYMQWGSGSYTTFGLYTEAQTGTVLPNLYEYVSTDTITTDTDDADTDDTTEGYKTYAKATSVVPGTEYLLVAQRDDYTYYAYPASSSSYYGYLSTGSISGYVDTIEVSTSYEDGFIIDTYDDGYSIKDVSTDRYYYQSSTYASFQISATDPGTVWYIDAKDDGTFKMECNGYFVQWGQSTYTTFGLYTEEQTGAVYPYLYALVEDEATDDDTTDDSTGINTVGIKATLDVNAPVYNLAGQRVSAATKGILIQNGRKFINK